MPKGAVMRYAFIKDPHFRFGLPKPIGRTENFHDEIKYKLNYLVDFCVKKQIDHIVATGDLLDIKAPSSYDFKAIKELTDIFGSIKEKGIKFCSIAGNHDLPSASLDRKSDSVYQWLVDNELIIDISSSDLPELSGFDYRSETAPLIEWLSTASLKKIVVVHEHIYPSQKDYSGFGNYLYYQDVVEALKINPNSKCKYLVCGHLHKGFETEVVNGITIINPWSFTRLARDSYALNDEHVPQFVALNTDSGRIATIDIPHKSFAESFIEAEVKRDQNLDEAIKSFIDKLSNVEEENDIDSILSRVSGVDATIREKIKYYVEKVSKNGN